MSSPTGSELSSERTVSMMGDVGWFSANARTAEGIVAVKEKAELIKGRKMIG
ncbi:hypothetical protein BN183_290009 [Clostridioides difficile E7]|nr:hypothetical protein BN183_290009 [Clostridioides difficile E7]